MKTRTKNKRVTCRRYQGNALTIWLDGAAQERLAQLKAELSELLGVDVASSVVIRTALKGMLDRTAAVAALGPGATGLAALALRSDLDVAADGRDHA
jgi:hypothetical protein